ncbi:MAG TPA: hypothetical protein PLY87_16735 [Planctomycetaceae bacterium]|nr:hypothetical protein [Planctomycetaceae bacterium]HQZ66742.1 hypothetical protein [Planctomycetaceae bacterium]
MTKQVRRHWTVVQVNVWTAAAILAVCMFVGFLLGTEYHKNGSLTVSPNALTGLLIDNAIFQQALTAEESRPQPDVLTVVHLKSSLNLIESDISQLSSKN